MSYSQAIYKLRRKLLLTQEELAEKLDVSFASVNRWESGKYEPTMKIKRKLKVLFDENNIIISED